MIFQPIAADLAQIRKATLGTIKELLPPANIGVQIAVFVKIQQGACVAVFQKNPRNRHLGHHVVVVDEAEGAGFEVLVEGLGKAAVAHPRLAEGVKAGHGLGRAPKSKPRRGQGCQRRA